MDRIYIKATACGIFGICLQSCVPEAPPSVLLPVPSAKQVEWQQMETYAFVHFGMNTFTDSEWGYGDADASLFNPTDLNCEQWVQTFANAGLKGVILTAKHHDGFCLWPSAYTDYSVKSSPWKKGKGDVVRELSDACKKQGIKFAVYLSSWDRNRADYGTPAYVEYFYNQLNELMTRYGEVFEIWIDGAKGGDGWYGGAKEMREVDRKTYYDFPRLSAMAAKLQPGAMLFSDGESDCRSFVSMRPGWFYHQNEDSLVKTVDQLKEIYYQSVGRNTTLVLNFPVDKAGRIHVTDSANAVEWQKAIRHDLANNLLAGLIPEATDIRDKNFSPKNLTDDDYDTYWATGDSTYKASLSFLFPERLKLDCLLLQEYIPLGQRVKKFVLEAFAGGVWIPVDVKEKTTTIGYKRILRFTPIETERLRIRFEESRGPICINNVEAYFMGQNT